MESDHKDEKYSHCNCPKDDNDECNCRPEDYIPPGSESLLYVNAYCLTRHFGGPEEGGWWFNQGEPLASIPIKAISKAGHKHCHQCHCAELGTVGYTPCKWGFHLEPLNLEQVENFKSHLREIYSHYNEGNIYSVNGGSELMILVQDHTAEIFPKQIPRYE